MTEQVDLDALIATATAMREQLGDEYPKTGSILDLWLRTATALTAVSAERDAAIRDLYAGFAESDHLSAKYYQRMRDAERERDEAREAAEANHLDGERNYERYLQALAVIERARESLDASTGEGAAIDEALVHLASVPADALRERDAEKWGEGHRAGIRWKRGSEYNKPNPYRKRANELRKEQST